jgi:hypothetical protein
MSISSRLTKDSIHSITLATRIIFVRKIFESGSHIVTALVYIADDAYPLLTSVGDGSYWDCHDIEKAKRSIRRHNKKCLIIDRRDFVYDSIDMILKPYSEL